MHFDISKISVKKTSIQTDQDVDNIAILLRFQISFFDTNFMKSHLALILPKKKKNPTPGKSIPGSTECAQLRSSTF